MSDAIAARTALRIQNWAEIFAAQAESGLTIREFCKNRGLSEGSYYYWLHKVRKHILDASSPTEEKEQPVQFAQLPMPAMPAHQVPLRRIEIDYGGFHVAVDADTPTDNLRHIFIVLKELNA